eukprot:TRINITY_DN4176_c0_g1_i1.p1 TRINITY_DN4176_c0_g1~~TRINITY_DN4176_c0_g1_i1.p1  ORF type:complete len:303 (+),score=63.50 TRINITY_DN4176_c0_g1_i1:86-910(+)
MAEYTAEVSREALWALAAKSWKNKCEDVQQEALRLVKDLVANHRAEKETLLSRALVHENRVHELEAQLDQMRQEVAELRSSRLAGAEIAERGPLGTPRRVSSPVSPTFSVRALTAPGSRRREHAAPAPVQTTAAPERPTPPQQQPALPKPISTALPAIQQPTPPQLHPGPVSTAQLPCTASPWEDRRGSSVSSSSNGCVRIVRIVRSGQPAAPLCPPGENATTFHAALPLPPNLQPQLQQGVAAPQQHAVLRAHHSIVDAGTVAPAAPARRWPP